MDVHERVDHYVEWISVMLNREGSETKYIGSVTHCLDGEGTNMSGTHLSTYHTMKAT